MRLLKVLWQCLFRWSVNAYEPNFAENSASLVLAFGKRKMGDVLSNIQLANICLGIKEKHPGHPLIVQQEIAAAIDALSYALVIDRPSQGKDYLNTRDIVKQATDWCRQAGIVRINIVAHPAHQWRAYRLLTRQDYYQRIDVVATAGLVGYDRQSSQWWTRRRLFWIMREIPCRCYYLFRGWI
ncbi:MAG: hypothetical protein V1838_05935 [Patescibacteria group bacterium]